MGGKSVLFVGMFVALVGIAFACPDYYTCLTWGNEKDMQNYHAFAYGKNSSCNDSMNMTFDSGKAQWTLLSFNYLDDNKGKDSFQVLVDGKTVGTVNDFTGPIMYRRATLYISVFNLYGRHTVTLRQTEKDGCDDTLTLIWAGYSTQPINPGSGTSARSSSSNEVFIIPQQQTPEEIPEYGIIGLVIALLGSFFCFFIVRRT